MRRLVLVFVAAVALTACTTSTAPPPGETPVSGMVTIVYDRAAAGVTRCLSEGSASEQPYCNPKASSGVFVSGLTVAGERWLLGTEVIKQEDGTFKVTVNAPSSTLSGRLKIQISDSWICPPAQICNAAGMIGKGITVLGVRLADGFTETSFLYYPPSDVRP